MEILVIIGAILFIILLAAIVYGVEGLILWGVGAFICWAFQIPFEFTFVHGVATAFIINILKDIFKITMPKKDNDNVIVLKKFEKALNKYLK